MKMWAVNAPIIPIATFLLATFFAIILPAVTVAEPRFALPLDCTLGDTCYIQNFVDRDPGPGITDFTCDTQTYNGHKGTDFALPSTADMDAGVAVLAAAPGVILGRRDGMHDIPVTPENLDSIDGRECGNGVVIDHGNGWHSQYCHMKRGSVSVHKGEKVTRGTPLGHVGLSGKTTFPHLHISIRKDGKVVDPFAPNNAVTCAGPSPKTLWDAPLRHSPGGLISTGFTAKIPKFSAVKSGTAAALSLRPDAPALVFWTYAFGAHKNDTISLKITGPMGFVHQQTIAISRAQPLLFRAAGKRRKSRMWATGTYIGTATLLRDNTIIAQRISRIDITP